MYDDVKIIPQEVIVREHDFAGLCEHYLAEIEDYYRTCYDSNDKATGDVLDAANFIKARIKVGHESPLEHEVITVNIITNRAIANEIVRHRIGSYSQASTRYINYKDKFAVIYPLGLEENSELYWDWINAMAEARLTYLDMLEHGAKKDLARGVLPLDFATKIIVTYNLRMWRHFLKTRCAKAAHPQFRQIAIPTLLYFKENLPGIFDDIEYDKSFKKEDYAKIGDYDGL